MPRALFPIALAAAALLTVPSGCGDGGDELCQRCICKCDGVETKLKQIKDEAECKEACETSCSGSWETASTCPAD